MENELDGPYPSRPSHDEATDALAMLEADRHRLADRTHVPWNLLAALGGVGAWWVGAAAFTTPGADYEPPTSIWLALGAVFVVLHLTRRETGIRFSTMGASARWAVGGIVATCTLLFSVSLGLVSFGLQWAVALTSLVGFVATTWLAGVAYRSAVQSLRRG